jgi:beta-phosphoglucomutase-like phosphatase (HAD superfamily)
MSDRPVLFLDDGGVMNDNRVRGPQWQAILGPFMRERYGGDAEAWSAINPGALKTAWDAVVQGLPGYRTQSEFHRDYAVRWTHGMFKGMGMPPPPHEECERLVEDSSLHVLGQISADISGVVDAIRSLHGAGFALHTASGTLSSWLDAILCRMEVRGCFGTLYGPDLIDFPKGGPGYYRKIFADARVDPATAVVIESDPGACAWAEAAGARAILVDVERDGPSLEDVAAELLTN